MGNTRFSQAKFPSVGKTSGGGPAPDLTPFYKHEGWKGDVSDLQSWIQGPVRVDGPADGKQPLVIPEGLSVGGFTLAAPQSPYPGYTMRLGPNDWGQICGFNLNPSNPNGYGVVTFFASDDQSDPVNGSQGFLFASGNPAWAPDPSQWNNIFFMSTDYGYQFFLLPNAEVLGTDADCKLVARDGITQDWFGVDTTPETVIPTAVGVFSWNDTDKTVDLQLPDGVTLQLGQETQLIATNNTGADIPNGKLVYVSGASGNRVTIALADADGVGTDGVIGMTTQDILNNQSGKVTLVGLIRDVNTLAYAPGTALYLSTTPGEVTATAPTYPTPMVLVGYVSRQHAVNGSILVYVRAQPQAAPLAAPYGQELFSYSVSETEGAIGQNGALNATSSAGTRGFAFIPSGTVLLSKMRVQITQTTASNMRLGIYDASGNRVAQTARFSPVLGINTVSLTVPATLTGGTLYYMAYWTDDTTANVRFKVLSGRSVSTAQPLDQRSDPNEMPASIGSGMTNTQYRPWLMISG